MSSPDDDPAQANGDMGSGHEAYGNLGESQAAVEVARPEDSENILNLFTAEKYKGYPTQRILAIRDGEGRVVAAALAGLSESHSDGGQPHGAILEMMPGPNEALTRACHAWLEGQGAEVWKPPADEPRPLLSPAESAAAFRHAEPIDDEELVRGRDGRIIFPDGRSIQSP